MKKIAFSTIILIFIFSSITLGSDLKILSLNNYVDSIDYLHVVGEIKNNSSSSYEYVQAIASFKDSSGKTIDSSFTFTLLDTLAPGQTSPFKISIKDRDSIKKYSVQVQGIDILPTHSKKHHERGFLKGTCTETFLCTTQ